MVEKFDNYNSLADLIYRVQDIYNNTDGGLFKLEAKLGDEDEANVLVTQDGEEQCDNNDQNDDTSTPEDVYQHFLTQHRDILINDIINGTVCEVEVEPNFDDVNEEHIFEDDVTILPNENIFQAFEFVVEKRNINALDEKSYDNLILKALNVMKLKNRECGSENRVCKYNTLNQKWLERTDLSVPKEDSSEIVKNKVIERGSVVSIERDVGVFLLFVVWRKDFPGNSKSRKWFPSINGDNTY